MGPYGRLIWPYTWGGPLEPARALKGPEAPEGPGRALRRPHMGPGRAHIRGEAPLRGLYTAHMGPGRAHMGLRRAPRASQGLGPWPRGPRAYMG